MVAGCVAATAPSSVCAQSLQELPPQEALGLEHASTSGASDESAAIAFAVRALMQELAGGGSGTQYKDDKNWPGRNFRGVDFLEPFIPVIAGSNGDIGTIVLDTALPYSLLVSAFAARSTDQTTLTEIGRWDWVGVDERQDNYVFYGGLLGLAIAGAFLPSTQAGGQEHYWRVFFDRLTVFGAGMLTAYGTTEVLKHAISRRRPNGEDSLSRPSGHATGGFAAMAFLSNGLRDWWAPHKEKNLGIRILKEVGAALPYLGAGYLALERVHGKDHFLTDTFLGGAIGSFSMSAFYAWSFARTSYDDGKSWLQHISVGYDPTSRAVQILVHSRF